ncbi:MAG: HlyD family efflux transporter periplasmic adaptor subunit [Steroidobacteraceae bacterium]|jgi:HlyD family secretion protein
MAAPAIKLETDAPGGMDRSIQRGQWSPTRWPIALKVAIAVAAAILLILLVIRFFSGSGERTVRLPVAQVTVAAVGVGIFHDLIPLRASVVPRETVYVDAIDGGRVDRVLVEPGDMVRAGQPMLELSNTNLALQVIQQESQINQAISELQQNEIALEQNQLANDRALAEIDYNLVRLGRTAGRREELAAKGALSLEERDVASDELAYYKRLRPIQAESGARQSALRERLLPSIHEQLEILRGNLAVVHDKLNGLVIRAPVAGKVTAIDLKVGEIRNASQRLAEVTPQTGMKLIADIDEFYLTRVRVGQTATVTVNGDSVPLTIKRVYPQVQSGQFRVDLDFQGASPPTLVEGAAAQGRLQLGGDTQGTILAIGPFIERTGGDWAFVLRPGGDTAERRRIKVGRRTSEQLEILRGLRPGEQVITSDYTGIEKADRIVLTH